MFVDRLKVAVAIMQLSAYIFGYPLHDYAQIRDPAHPMQEADIGRVLLPLAKLSFVSKVKKWSKKTYSDLFFA